MKCIYCGGEIPDDSRFCQLCGRKLPEARHTIEPTRPIDDRGEYPRTEAVDPEDMPRPASNAPTGGEARPGREIPTPPQQFAREPITPPAPPEPPKPPEQSGEADAFPPEDGGDNKRRSARKKPKNQGGKGRVALTVIAIVLIVGLAGLNVYQYLARGAAVEENEATIAALRQDNADMSDEVDSLTDEVKSLTAAANAAAAELEGLRVKADDLAAIKEFLSGYDAGYGSEEFHASTPILILAPYESGSFELLSFYDSGVTVTMTTDGDSADASFSEDEWLTAATTIYVDAYEPGLTTLSFKTDTYYDTFDVLVVVVDDAA